MATGEAEPHVLDVGHDLLEQFGDVVVVELVDHLPSGSLSDDEAEMAQQAKLVRDRGALHAHALGDLVHGRGAGVQSREDAQSAGSRERLNALRRRLCESGVAEEALDLVRVAIVSHDSDYS